MTVVEVVFWVSLGPDRVHARRAIRCCCARWPRCGARPRSAEPREPPSVSLIVAAHDEDDVIEDKVRNMLALDYPPGGWS